MQPLDEKLGISDGIERDEIELDEIDIKTEGMGNDLKNDYEIIRNAIITSILRAEEVLTESVKSIKMSGGNPREIEASASILKTLSTSSICLLDLHKELKDFHDVSDNKSKSSGTLAEVIKLVKTNNG